MLSRVRFLAESLSSVYTGSDPCLPVLLVSVGPGLQGRAAVAAWQSRASLVNGPCVVIQNAAGGVLEKGVSKLKECPKLSG